MDTAETKHLFVFGFEDPIEFETNRASGSDFESSRAVWIVAHDSATAEDWGRSIAENFIRELFTTKDCEGYSWRDGDFAHWIESPPKVDWTAEYLSSLPIVRAGELPEFSRLDNPTQRPK